MQAHFKSNLNEFFKLYLTTWLNVFPNTEIIKLFKCWAVVELPKNK